MSRVLNKALNCNVSGLYQNSTNNGRTGYALTKANTNRRLGTVYNVTRGRKTVRPGIAKLGSGVQGVAYLASTSANGNQNIVIKVSPKDRAFPANNQPCEAEYTIQKALYKIVSSHIPVPYKFIHCRNFVPASNFTRRNSSIFDYDHQYVMYAEYAHGGTLKEWIHKMGRRVTDDDMAKMIRQVVSTLKKINARYPEFRHNDLHLGNIYVDDTGSFPRLMLADFGLSRLRATGSNPIVNRGNHVSSGISSRTSVKYDVHYFLNCLAFELRGIDYLPQTKLFLKRMLPTNLRGPNTRNVTAFRLKLGVSTTAAPSFNKVLDDPFIHTARANNSPARNVSSPRITVRNVHVERASGRNAAEIARNALAGIAAVSITTAANASRRPTAAEFLRMSPRSRAALMSARPRGPAGNSRSVVVRNVALPRGAAIERSTVRRVGGGAGVRRLPIGTGTRVTRPATPMTRAEVEAVLGPPTSSEAALLAPRARPGPSRASPRSGPSRASPAARPSVAAMSPRRRAAIVRATRNARAAAGARARTAASRAVPSIPVVGPAVAAGPSSANRATALLTGYVNGLANQRTLTRRSMKAFLTRSGYTADRANTIARAYEQKWVNNRSNVKSAMRHLSSGKNLNRLGFPSHIKNIAQRRITLKLTNTPNSRLRARGRLMSGYKKDELLVMARAHRVAANASMTKDQIISALFG